MHPEYPFSSNFIDLDGHRLHYIDEGQGPAVVAVHGNPTWSFYYRKVISQLEKNFRVIAPDNMGCGLSDKPQNYPYTLDKHIENLSRLLEKLAIKECSLIVHDWGGAIGMGYAVRHPQSIKKVIILNSAAFRSRNIPFRIAVCKWPLFGELLVRGLNGFAWPATFMAVTKSMNSITKEYYLRPYDSWKNRIAIHRFVKDIPLHHNHPSYTTLVEIEKGLANLDTLKIPFLILWGSKDFCFTEKFYQQWKRFFPNAEAHLFRDYGHYVLEDGYQELKVYIQSFFKIHDNK